MATRSYHNLTSYYNIYFNALDAYNQGVKKVESGFRDDFNTPLPLFLYSSREASRMLSTDMDRTIRKCSKVAAMHSITAKPKYRRGVRTPRQREFFRKSEFVKWVDDAFLLMGKGYFQKRDYFPAMENFEYVIKQYPNDGLVDESLLWLARSHMELGRFQDALGILSRLNANPGLSKKLRSEVNAVYADWYIRQGELDQAIPYLEKVAQKYPGKKQRVRNLYVLAQLYEKTNQPVQAIRYYELVNKENPPYDMAFNARINRARLYQGDGSGGEQIRKELRKMLRDEKNYDYRDQIYYALADLDLKEGKTDQAVINYKYSVWSNTSNATQKALSYLALGAYYYDKPDYIPAGAYYDSATQSLPETFPEYARIMTFAADAKLLSDNLLVVFREDSLQRVAKMPADERNRLIDEKIAEVRKIEEERRAAEEEERLAMQEGRMRTGMGGMYQGSQRTMLGGSGSQQIGAMGGSQQFGAMSGGTDFSAGAGTSGWYFYNPSTMSFGMTEFIKIWGRRKLEDNWRRSNKKVITEAGDLTDEGETGDVSTPLASSKASQFKPTEREFYTADLPLNDTLLRESNQRISQALFNAGKIFKDNLQNTSESITYFERFITRFPEDDKLLFAYYNLYQIYEGLKIQSEMQRYKDLILQKFPESRSAKIISNPNYFKELDEARAQVMAFYEETYQLFNRRAWTNVVQNCEKAETAFALNPIRDKFGYLKVISASRLAPADTVSLVKGLNDLVFKYPTSEIADQAKTLLAMVSRGPAGASALQDEELPIGGVARAATTEEKAEYLAEDSDTHFYVMITSGNSVDVGRLKFRISNFNVEKFTDVFFEVASSVFENELQMITVKNFTNKMEALTYYQLIGDDLGVFEGMAPTDYRHFVISKDNFTRFFRTKNVAGYLQYFRANYQN
ncbi:MAG: tetratricopeptide repeat protein [Bacteroidales bacterium]